jgi:hypothetical protein
VSATSESSDRAVRTCCRMVALIMTRRVKLRVERGQETSRRSAVGHASGNLEFNLTGDVKRGNNQIENGVTDIVVRKDNRVNQDFHITYTRSANGSVVLNAHGQNRVNNSQLDVVYLVKPGIDPCTLVVTDDNTITNAAGARFSERVSAIATVGSVNPACPRIS